MTTRPSLVVIGLVAFALIVAACSAAPAAPAPTPGPPVSDAPATISPDEPVTGDPGGILPDPGAGEPVDLVPRPGQRDVHPVNINLIEVRSNGDRIAARLTWTSGVEPCHVFDSVLTGVDGTTITLTVREGSGDAGQVCIEIAQIKTTVVDLGVFAPGTYTIRAGQGDAQPVRMTIG